jgi:hypothetical protein
MIATLSPNHKLPTLLRDSVAKSRDVYQFPDL